MSDQDPATETWRAAMDDATRVVNEALNPLGPPPSAEHSTSAQLRQTQAALAGSQADLSRVERERDEALDDRDFYMQASNEAQINTECTARAADRARAELSSARQELARVEQARGEMATTNVRLHGEVLTVQSERDYLRAQLDEQQAVLSADLTRALAELDAARQSARDARSWDVARQDIGHACASCSQPIVRSQGFLPLADAKGFFVHCACPDREAARERGEHA